MNDNSAIKKSLIQIINEEGIDLMGVRVGDTTIRVEAFAGGLIARILATAEYLAFRAKQAGIGGSRSWTISVNGITMEIDPLLDQYELLEKLHYNALQQLNANLRGAVALTVVALTVIEARVERWHDTWASAIVLADHAHRQPY